MISDTMCYFFFGPFKLLGWLEEKLPACSKLPPETQSVIHPVLIALEDRSAEVRKKAQAVVPHLMAHVGYEAMVKAAGKLQVIDSAINCM